MRKLFIFLLLLWFLTSCSMTKAELSKFNLSRELGQFNILIVEKNEEQMKNNDLNLYNEINTDKIHEIVWTWDRDKFNYTKAFDIDEYPTFLVFDTKGLVLKTTEISELEEFFDSKSK